MSNLHRSEVPQLLTSDRDVRLDLFRGLANWAIFLDHVPNNVVSWITTKNYGFSDAAELFVFVSGYTVAFVYGRMLRARGIIAASFGIFSRAWQIYVAYVLLFMLYIVAIGYLSQRYGHAHLLDEFNIRRLIADPIEYRKHALLLEYKPLNLDVLPLYIVLMLAFPPMLWLLARNAWAALGLSFGLYLAARFWGWNLPGYPQGSWYFNPFAWQFLFVIGAWFASGGAAIVRSHVYSRTILAAAALFLVFAAAVTLMSRFGIARSLPEIVRSIFIPNHKTDLGPYRIVHFLSLTLIVSWLLPQDSPLLTWRVWRPVIVSGQRSLEVFCSGVFLAFVAYFALDLISQTIVAQIAVSAAGIAAMTAVAYARTWIRRQSKDGRTDRHRQGGFGSGEAAT